MGDQWWIGLIGLIPAVVAGYRYRWGCRLRMHRYRDAFPATYTHRECVQCGHRDIPVLWMGGQPTHAPVDRGWLETGIKTELRMPPKGKGRVVLPPRADQG